MTKHIQTNRRIAAALVVWLATTLPLLAQQRPEPYLQQAQQDFQAGNYEQCINDCMIYISLKGSTEKDELQLKAERMLACKAAGTLEAYRYMVQYNPNDAWAKEQLTKAATAADDNSYCVFFSPGKRDFDNSQSTILNDIAATFKRDSNAYEIIGYYMDDANKNLISERTRRVKRALTDKGISDKRFEMFSLKSSLASDDNTLFLNEAVVIKRAQPVASIATPSVTSTNKETSTKTTENTAAATGRHEPVASSANTASSSSSSLKKEVISAHGSFMDYIHDVEYEEGFGVSLNYGTKSLISLGLNYTWSNLMIFGDLCWYFNGKKYDIGENTTIKPFSSICIGPGFYTKYFSIQCGVGYCVGETEATNHSENIDNGSSVVTDTYTKGSKGFFCYKPSVSGYIPIDDDKFISLSVGYLGVPKFKDFSSFTFGIGFQKIL